MRMKEEKNVSKAKDVVTVKKKSENQYYEVKEKTKEE
jgi:hypothetical protein